MKKLGLFFSMLMVFINCKDDNTTLENAIIIYNEENVSIELKSIIDERCPTIVVCVTEGTAIVELEMKHQGDSESFTLYTNPDNGPVQKLVLGKTVLLKKVNPYPQQANDLMRPLEEYDVVIEVS